MLKLSKINDYLLDNHNIVMISDVEHEVKEKTSGTARRRFSLGGLAPILFAKDAEEDGLSTLCLLVQRGPG